MTPELPSNSTLPALPVRRRETLEILDTALKLYRRYFWVLMGWSALVFSFALVPIFNWFSFFAMPLLFGAVSCCVAAAVRGQSVKFSQCWSFTKPRYGALLGSVLLSYLILFGVSITIFIAATLVWLLGVWMLSSAPEPIQIVFGVLGGLGGAVVFSAVGVMAFGWSTMVPIVVCLEDDKRSSAAIGRSFDLLKGNWRRVFGLCLILGLAVSAVFVIVGAFYALFGLGLVGTSDTSSLLGLFATMSAFFGIFFLVWQPAQYLVVAVLYLDLRVRREALDLEWTAYASAPTPLPEAGAVSVPASEVSLPTSPNAPLPIENAVPAVTTPTSFAAGGNPSAGEHISLESLPESENEARRD